MASSNWTNAKGLSAATRATRPSPPGLVARGDPAALGGRSDRQRVLGRRGGHRRLLEAAELADQGVPLTGLQDRGGLAPELVVVAVQRLEAHVDVVVVVRQRERVLAEVEQ